MPSRSRARRSAPGASLGLALLLGCGDPAPAPDVRPAAAASRPERPNLLLIVVDTLRADLLGAYGEERPTSPEIDAWARGALRFARVTAAAPTTLASVTSLLTGRYPHDHGVYRNGVRWPRGLTGLPSVLRRAGYATAGFVASTALAGELGVGRGFDVWDQPRAGTWRRGAHVTRAALGWLRRRPADGPPFFLLLHYFDPHYPYWPPPAYRTVFGGPYEGWVRGRLEHIARVRGALRRGEAASVHAQRLVALHLGEIRYVDGRVGELFVGLEEMGLRQETLVVFTADHGETLLEHDVGYFDHGATVYDTEVRIPLIVAGPGVPAGRREALPVSNVDVAPTLLRWLGLEVPEAMEGRSFAPALRGEAIEAEERVQFSEGTKPHRRRPGDGWPNRHAARAVVSGGFKVVHFPWRNDRWEMYDLEADPAEQDDLFRSYRAPRATRERLVQRLEAWSASAPEGGHGSPVREGTLAEKLHALGYAD